MTDLDETLAHRFFLTDVCETPAYRNIQDELLAKYTRDSSEELPKAFYAELSDRLRDLFNKCLQMCEVSG